MKRLLLLMGLMFFLSGLCRGMETDTTDFRHLCRVYATATQALNEMHSPADWSKTEKILSALKKECRNNLSLQELLQLTYQTCPNHLKSEYEHALKKQEEMTDAVKRLSMGGILQDKNVASDVNTFVKSIYLPELIYNERRGHEGAPHESKRKRDKRMKWWRDGKFGMFIHYGLYSGLAGEFQGKKYDGCVEWIQMQSGADFETYKKEALPRFTPKSGMAEQWVKLAKEAGCAYTVLTTRHHEGFNLFDTPYYDFNSKKLYDIDIVKEYADACEKYHMKAGFYVSLLDWNHPDYDPTGSGISYPAGNYEEAKAGKRQFGHHERYKDYLYTVFNTLLDHYKVDLVWWDYSQPKFQGDAAWGATRLMKALFDKYPKAIQNNRLYHSENHLSEGGIRVTPTWKGDYSTAEQHIPATGIDGDWEACQTLNGTWGYSAFNQKWKSADDLIRQLIDVVSRGGNLLLNIGPKADGSIPEESVRLFHAIGQWLKANGEAIYGTRANPFDEEFAWGRITRKGNDKLYLILYQMPKDGKIELPCRFKRNKAEAHVLHQEQSIPVTHDSRAKKCVLNVSDIDFKKPATVIELNGKWRL